MACEIGFEIDDKRVVKVKCFGDFSEPNLSQRLDSIPECLPCSLQFMLHESRSVGQVTQLFDILCFTSLQYCLSLFKRFWLELTNALLRV